MAVYRYATKDLSISNAKAFLRSLTAQEDTSAEKKGVVLYAVIGKVDEYPNEPTPVQPEDNEQYLHYDVHRSFIGGKKITTDNVSHVVPRYDWTSGTVYSMYRDTDTDMYDRKFYVVTNEMNVYKCLFNNKGAASTIKPTGFSTTPFTTSDGYTWKYMYTISLGEANRFMTAVHMPVKTLDADDGSTESGRQVAVQNAAVNGAIEVVETVKIGSGYSAVSNGQIEAAGKFILRLSAVQNEDISTTDNFYNGSSVYILAGTGAGQLRRITNYEGSTKTLTVNTAFSTICNTDTTVIISPTLTIIGDGQGAKGYTTVSDSGSIDGITIIDKGQKYTRGEALITANSLHGTGATANVVISPVGGHGKDPVRELFADKLMFNVNFRGSEGISANGNGYIPSNTEFRTISIVKDPILKVDENNNRIAVEKIANTSNAPTTLRYTTRLTVSYENDDIKQNTPIVARNTITNERLRLRAETGALEFVTELSPTRRLQQSLANAVKGANGNVVYVREDETNDEFHTVYINNVDSYSNYVPFTKDDVILRSTDTTKLAVVQAVKGPEANTYSGEVVFTENIQAVDRNPEQKEEIKIILDF